MNRKTRWLFIVFVVLAFVFVSMFGALQYFGSPSGSARLLSWAQATLEQDHGTRLEFSEGRFSLFSGLHFKNLKVVKTDERSTMEFKAEALDLDYSWSLLKREIEIRRFHLLRSSVSLQSRGPAAPEEDSKSSGLEALADWIKRPPFQIRIQNASIEDLSIALDAQDGQASTLARLKDLDLDARLEMVKGKLDLHGELRAIEGGSIAYKTASPDGSSLDTKFDVAVSGQWAFKIENLRGEWEYVFDPSDIKAVLRNVAVAQRASATLNQLNTPRIDLGGHARFRAKGKDLLATHGSSVDQASGKFDIVTDKFIFDQMQATAETGDKLRATIEQQTATLTARLEQNLEVDLNYEAKKIFSSHYFLKPANFVWKTQATWPRDLGQADLKSRARLDAIEIMSFDGLVKLAETKEIKGAFALEANPALANLLKPASALKTSGPLFANANIEAVLSPSGTSNYKMKLDGDLAFKSEKFGHWSLNTTSEFATEGPTGNGRARVAQLERPKSPHSLPASVNGIVTLDYRFDMTPGRQSFHFEGDAPSVTLQSLGVVSETKWNLDAKSPNLGAASDLDFTFDLRQKDLALDPKTSQDLAMGLPRLTGLSAQATGSLRNGRAFALDRLRARFQKPSVEFNASATGDLQTKNLMGQSELSVRLPEFFSPTPGQEIKGSINLPFGVSVLQGKEIALNGHIDLKKVDWKKGGMAASGISGRIPFTEKLKWSGDSFSFTHLIVQNPFERVDFERVRPLLEGTEQVRIDEVHWEERTFGPLIGFFSLRQNMIFAHQFDLDAGQGRAYGQMFLDAYPRNMQVGVLARLTGLDLGEILPKKFLARAPSGGKTVSGRTGFNLNLHRAAMDGRLDVTEIGGPQLIAMINVLDPQYEDEKLNKVRSLLQVGYPTAVELSFADGYMNMEITLNVLGLSQRQSVRGIPISGLLSSTTADLLKKTEKGPLK